jgi:hypothetical protein
MRWGRWLAGGAVALVLAGALVFYFAFLPGVLAGDWKDGAREEYERSGRAMRDVYSTFHAGTFGVDLRALRRAKTIPAYLERLSRIATRSRDRLDAARSGTTNAANALSDLERGKLRHVPDWPLIGGSGALADAEKIADDERAYVRRARRFLAGYRRLVLYNKALVGFSTRAADAILHGLARVPEHPSEIEQLTRPLDRTVASLRRETRVFDRRATPPGMRAERRLTLEVVRVYGRELTELADAVRALDSARVDRAAKAFAGSAKRFSEISDPTIRRLLLRSKYRRQIDALRRADRQIAGRYDDL